MISGQGLFEGLEGEEVSGYEIHMAQSTNGKAAPAFRITQRGDSPCSSPDGLVDEGGKVFGTYIHGLFDNTNLRHALLARLRQRKGLVPVA